MIKIRNAPLVSIIMNCHNGEKYLIQSLNSILKQTYQNWELIFYDNRSEDNSKKIVRSYSEKKFKIFNSKKYLKLYEARNFAIKKAKGKYIAFLDTDDWWKKNKLKEQVLLFLKNKKTKIVYTNFYVHNQNNKKNKIINNQLSSGIITNSLLKNYTIGILTVMMEKNLFKKYKFNKNFNIIGDFDLLTRISLKHPFYKIDKTLAYYRSHENNFFKIKKKDYISELKYWIKINKRMFKDNNIKLIHPWITLKKLQIKRFFKIL